MERTINIKVIPQAKRETVKEENGQLKVYVRAPAVDGKANKALIRFLAEYYQIKAKNIKIIKGLKSRHKTITIL